MHELSLVEALLERLRALARDHPGMAVSRVEVAVGRDSCCVPATFRFLFTALAREEPRMAGARLELKAAPGSDVVLNRVELVERGESHVP